MSQNFHVIPYKLLPGQKYDAGRNVLTLDSAGVFTVTIKEYNDELDALEEQVKKKYEKRHALQLASKTLKPDSAAYTEYKKKVATLDKEIAHLQDNKSKLKEKYANVEWSWQLLGNGIKEGDVSHNPALSKGLKGFTFDVNNLKSHMQLSFSKLLEGGGSAWLEAFTKDDIGIGMNGNGMLVKATGTPVIVRTEWTDYDYKKITKTVGFGSKVLLHIYTKALYGQKLDIQLIDQDLFNANDVLEISKKTKMSQRVGVHKMHVNEIGKYGVDGMLINATQNDGSKEQYIQKIVVEVTIDYAWSKTAGETLKIYPTLTVPAEATFFKEYERSYIAVKMGEPVVQKPIESGNKPFTIGSSSSQGSKNDGKKVKDFTFGVFIDGTMNNKYNTIARVNWEKQRAGESEKNYNELDHLNVYAKSKKDVGDGKFGYKGKDYQYRYAEVSYENDLSNPAILFQNYKKDDAEIYKIYTEGMGTNTLADANENVDSYIKDDLFMGSGLGEGNAGITERVKRAIEQLEAKIKITGKETIGTLTIDVFGFSRGAAAARNFVHEITRPVYNATKKWEVGGHMMGISVAKPLSDANGYEVDKKYEDQLLPKNGWLGILLAKRDLEIQKLVIRFAGIYDTVAHHGIVQFNDARDLGLNSISKAQQIVHMTAGDEHRYNFSLTRINRKKNHIELNLPGVHCDVGGSYVEGRPEGNYPNATPDPAGKHILAEETVSDYDTVNKMKKIETFKETLIKEGWFKANQIKVNTTTSIFKSGATLELESYRPYVSNQYSFIPLHMMCKYGLKNGLPFDFGKLIEKKDFNNNTIFKDNVSFLKKIQTYLEEYAKQVEQAPEANIACNIPAGDLKQLRNHYLHYNAVVGMVNKPEAGRKRGIITS
jgi:hypothetical protein